MLLLSSYLLSLFLFTRSLRLPLCQHIVVNFTAYWKYHAFTQL